MNLRAISGEISLEGPKSLLERISIEDLPKRLVFTSIGGGTGCGIFSVISDITSEGLSAIEGTKCEMSNIIKLPIKLPEITKEELKRDQILKKLLAAKSKEERLQIAKELMEEVEAEEIEISIGEIKKLDEKCFVEKTKSGLVFYYVED